MLNETSILTYFDPRVLVTSRWYYPAFEKGDLIYEFWLDLEHGYFDTVGSLLHLYADEDRWAVVTETSGYSNRGDIQDPNHQYGQWRGGIVQIDRESVGDPGSFRISPYSSRQ